MTTTPPDAPAGPPPGSGEHDDHDGPRVTHDEVRDLGRLRRTTTDRQVAGVAGGLARHLDVDPVVLRVVFVVLSFFGGAGLLLYGGCWLLLPEDGAQEAPLHLDDRSRVVALLVLGGVAALALLGDGWGLVGFPWPLVLVAVVALVLLSRHQDPGSPAGPPPHPGHVPYAAPGYPPAASPGHPGPTGYTGYTGYTGHGTPPPNPRRRGPVLFWFTMALAVLGLGVLGLLAQGGLDVPAAAYPALVVAVCGVMLVIGAFWGRPGGLILVGLLAALVMAGTTVADRWDGTTLSERPTTAADVSAEYQVNAGLLELDLTDVRDLEALDGRLVHLENNVGEVRVLVPDGLDVDLTAEVHGPGNLDLFGSERGGIDIRDRVFHDGGPGDDPQLRLHVENNVGQVTVESR